MKKMIILLCFLGLFGCSSSKDNEEKEKQFLTETIQNGTCDFFDTLDNESLDIDNLTFIPKKSPFDKEKVEKLLKDTKLIETNIRCSNENSKPLANEKGLMVSSKMNSFQEYSITYRRDQLQLQELSRCFNNEFLMDLKNLKEKVLSMEDYQKKYGDSFVIGILRYQKLLIKIEFDNYLNKEDLRKMEQYIYHYGKLSITQEEDYERIKKTADIKIIVGCSSSENALDILKLINENQFSNQKVLTNYPKNIYPMEEVLNYFYQEHPEYQD